MIEPLYIPGNGLLHRLPAALKLAVLIGAGACLFLLRDLTALAGALALAVLLLALTGVRAAVAWRHLRPLVIIMALAAAVTVYGGGWQDAAAMLLRVGALAGLALAVTLSTRSTDLIDVCEKALLPLERAHLLKAGRVALALALTLRFVPEIWRNYQEIREAQAARGLGANPLAIVVPLIALTLKRADEVADAIDARGGHH